MAHQWVYMLATPAALIAAAWLLAPQLGQLPASLAGLKVYGAYAVIAIGILVSIAFARSRALLALCWLGIAYGLYRAAAQDGANPAAQSLSAALNLLLPLNLGVLSWLRERGVLNSYAIRRTAVILIQVLAVAGLSFAMPAAVSSWVSSPIPGLPWVPSGAITAWGYAALIVAFVTTVAAWMRTLAAIDLAMAGAIAAFGMAAARGAAPDTYALFVGAAALIITVGVLQDTFRMAFRDQLTGLPSRRALDERMAGLGRDYAVAMIDVDHFKQFNDRHGHDVGDQVLKMVAARLAHGANGQAYRYGGEEFTVLLPGDTVAEAIPGLEVLCKDIAGYSMALRGTDRPQQPQRGRQRRGGGRTTKHSVSVTVSIGVAERTAARPTPESVIQAADKALYRAKHKGRNQVSR
jgi:GGDEF domain-containing protein